MRDGWEDYKIGAGPGGGRGKRGDGGSEGITDEGMGV